MHDDLDDEVGVFDFDEFADHLLDQGEATSPSQLHGCLCGLLSAGAPAQAEYGLDALSQSLDIVLHGELASRIMQLYVVTDAALRNEEFTFLPLLPDDDEDLAQRTMALAGWCNGFLTGFAYVTADPQSADSNLSPDSSEALRDIAALAEADATEEENGDEAEEHYFELVEYLRVAVVNVFMDGASTTPDGGLSPGTGRSLH